MNVNEAIQNLPELRDGKAAKRIVDILVRIMATQKEKKKEK